MSVSVSLSSNGHTALIQPMGEQDLATAGRLREALLSECGEALLVVIDFGQTTFIDSSILGVIVAGHKRLAQCGGRLIGVNAAPRVAKVLSMTGIDALLQMRGDLQGVAANALLAPPRPAASTTSVLAG